MSSKKKLICCFKKFFSKIKIFFFPSKEITPKTTPSLLEKSMIQDILMRTETLSSTTVKAIMIPRIDVQTLSLNTYKDTLFKFFCNNHFSRIPVHKESVDDIVGLLHIKDIIQELMKNPKELPNIEKFLRPAHFVPESKKILHLMQEMKLKKTHMSIVIDEYGGFSGIVSMEDVLEEIVGNMDDEYEQSEDDIKKVGNYTYLIHARADLEDINKQLNLSLPRGKFDTIGGFVFDLFGRIPKINEQATFMGLHFHVANVIKNRIMTIRLRLPQQELSANIEHPEDTTN